MQLSREDVVAMYKRMLLIRYFEEVVAAIQLKVEVARRRTLGLPAS